MNIKYIQTIVLAFGFLFIFPFLANAQVEASSLKLQVPVEGFKFSAPSDCGTQDGQTVKCYRWAPDYIVAIYNYSIGIIGILSAIAIMVGGLRWLTAGGDSSKVGSAKKMISGSIAGLIIGLSSYFMLYVINPDLVILKPIRVTNILKKNIEISVPDIVFSMPFGEAGIESWNPSAAKDFSMPKQEILDMVKKSAEINKVDPRIILAMMQAESSYDKNATSPKGAGGLMQIMPRTFELLYNENKNVPGIKYDRYDPYTNIIMAGAYIRDIIKRNNLMAKDEIQRVIDISSMYNMGEERYRKGIRFDETTKYAAKVVKNFKAQQ